MLGNTIFGSLLSQIPPAPQNGNQNSVSIVSNSSTVNAVPSVTFSVMPQYQFHQNQTTLQQHQQQQQQQQQMQQQQQQQQQQQLQSTAQHLHQHSHQLQQIQHQNLISVTQIPTLVTLPTLLVTGPGTTHPGFMTSIHNMGNVSASGLQIANVAASNMNSTTSYTLSTTKSLENTIEQVVSSITNNVTHENKKPIMNGSITIAANNNNNNNRSLACPHCGKTFIRRNQLERHVRLHTNQQQNQHHQPNQLQQQQQQQQQAFRCSECSEVFHMRESFQLHIRTHSQQQQQTDIQIKTEAQPFHCEICHLGFNSKTMLVKHRKKEHSGQGNNNSWNGTNNDQSTGKSNHYNENGKIGNHICPTCNKRFINRYGLRRHVRTHTGERPHDCDVCGLSFMERSHMKQHRMTHTGETPYHCELCNRGFNRKFSYHRHLRWHAKSTLIPSSSSSNGIQSTINNNNNIINNNNTIVVSGNNNNNNMMLTSSDCMTQLLNSVVAESTTSINNSLSNCLSIDSKPIITYTTANNNDINGMLPIGGGFTMQLNPHSSHVMGNHCMNTPLITATPLGGTIVQTGGGMISLALPSMTNLTGGGQTYNILTSAQNNNGTTSSMDGLPMLATVTMGPPPLPPSSSSSTSQAQHHHQHHQQQQQQVQTATLSTN